MEPHDTLSFGSDLVDQFYSEVSDAEIEIELLKRRLGRSETDKARKLAKKLRKIYREAKRKKKSLDDAQAVLDELNETSPAATDAGKRMRESMQEKIDKAQRKVRKRMGKKVNKAWRGHKPDTVGLAQKMVYRGLAAVLALVAFFTEEAMAGVDAVSERGTKVNALYRAALRKDCKKVRGLISRSDIEAQLIAELAQSGMRSAPLAAERLIKLARKACGKK